MRNLLFTIALSFISIPLFSQSWDKGGNNPSINPFTLGSNTNNAIGFETNNINRQIIRNGNATNAAGRIAMGNNLLAGFIPRSRLHLHHDDVSNISLRFTNSSTGTGNGDGFEVGYRAISPIINRQFAELNNRENTAITFFC